MLPQEIPEILQHNPRQDCTQVSQLTGRTLWNIKTSEHFQVYKQRWKELCQTVPTGDISENSARL